MVYAKLSSTKTRAAPSAKVRSSPPTQPYVPPPYHIGYFAFPPVANVAGKGRPGNPSFMFSFYDDRKAREEQARAAREEQERVAREAREAEIHAKERAWEERCRRAAQAREEQLARERAEALKGEMWWVRFGFYLLDERGHKLVERTEALRAEVRILDEETRRLTMWNAYESRWRELFASSTPVAFKDVPWPLPATLSSVDELADSEAAIEEFIFATLIVRTNTVTRRERLRASLLRWHPDKVSAVFVRVVPEDMEAVRDGINTVFRHLKALQDKERQV